MDLVISLAELQAEQIILHFKNFSPEVLDQIQLLLTNYCTDKLRHNAKCFEMMKEISIFFFTNFSRFCDYYGLITAAPIGESFLLYFALCISDGIFDTGRVLITILQTTEILNYYHDILSHKEYLMPNNYQTIFLKLRSTKLSDGLLLDAAPSSITRESLFPYLLVVSGVLYNIKENFNRILNRKEPFNEDFYNIIQQVLPFLTKSFQGVFEFSRILLQLRTSQTVLGFYYDAIIQHLKEPSKQQLALDELRKRPPTTLISLYETQKLSSLLECLLNTFEPQYKNVIQAISQRLTQSQFSKANSIYEKVKNTPELCFYCYDFIKNCLPSSIIDDVFSNYKDKFNLSIALFLNALINDHYKSNQLEYIFEKLIIIHNEKDPNTNFIPSLIPYSKDEEVHNAILNSIDNLINQSHSLLSKLHFYDILSYLTQCSSQRNSLLYDKLSEIFLDILDSIEILPTMKNYPFLQIKDLPYFVDITPHNSNFYSILSCDKYLGEINEVVDDITTICKQDDDNIENSITFHNFLLKSYEKTNNLKFVLTLLKLPKNPDEFFESIHQTIDHKEFVHLILSDLGENSPENSIFKRNLIKISSYLTLQDHPVDNLNHDQMAFLISIGHKVDEQQLIGLFNESQSFYPKYVVVKKFPNILTLLSSEDILNAYIYGCSISNFDLCELLYSHTTLPSDLSEKNFLNTCLIDTQSKISNCTLKILSKELPIFTNPKDIRLTILNLAKSEKQNLFLDVLRSYIEKLDGSNEKITKAVFETYFDIEFPSIYRIAINTNTILAFCSSQKSFFGYLFKQLGQPEPINLRAQMDCPYINILANLPSIFNQVSNSKYQRIFHRLNFGYEQTIDTPIQVNSIDQSISTFNVQQSLVETLNYSIYQNQLDGQYSISLNSSPSVSDSLKLMNPFSVFKKSPSILFLRVQFDTENNFIIDDQIDLSPYSLNTSYYKLNSVLCKNNAVYLRNFANEYKYLKCMNDQISYENSIEFNISYLIYEKVSNINEDYSQYQIEQFIRTFSQYGITNYIPSQAIIRALSSNDIDWKQMEDQKDFDNIAFNLISKYQLFNLFKFLSNSSQFANFMFGESDGEPPEVPFILELLNNKKFVDNNREAIFTLINHIENAPLFAKNLIDDLNEFNYDIIFDIIDSFSERFGKANASNRFTLIKEVNGDLIHTKRVEEFLRKTIETADLDDTTIRDFVLNQTFGPIFLKVLKNDALKSRACHYINFNYFAQIIDQLELSDANYIINSLPKNESERPAYYAKVINTFGSNPQFPDFLNQVQSLDLNNIELLFKTEFVEQAGAFLLKQIPPNYMNYNPKVPEMLVQILNEYSQNANKVGRLLPFIQKYATFFSYPDITKTIMELFFSLTFEEKTILQMTDTLRVLPSLTVKEVESYFSKLFINSKYINNHCMTLFFIVACRAYENNPKLAFQMNTERFDLASLFQQNNQNDPNELRNLVKRVQQNAQSPRFSQILIYGAFYMKNHQLFYDVVTPVFEKGLNNMETVNMALHASINVPCLLIYAYNKLLSDEINATVKQAFWKTQNVLILIQAVFHFISYFVNNYYQKQSTFMIPYDENANQTEVLINKLIEITILGLQRQVFTNDFPIPVLQMSGNSIVPLTIPKTIEIVKYPTAILENFYKFLRLVSYLYPLFNYQIIKFIIEYKHENQYYNFYEKVDSNTRMSFTRLVTNSFREVLGDKQFMTSLESPMFKMAIILIKSQFMQLLQTSNFTVNEIKLYCDLFRALLCYPNETFSRCIAKHFSYFPFVWNILFVKQLNSDDDVQFVKDFFSMFFSKVKLTQFYPAIFVKFVESLDTTDLSNRLNVFLHVLKILDEPQSIQIIQLTFSKIESLAYEHSNVPFMQELFDQYILTMK